ncbi:MAG: sulfite exporter TauE/SafE family protein [Deltaproteobacteria bacterium]|nr:sulfite exporter TauE/SafE family protein [Deltaproteobacteria bacterium]
MAGLLVGLTAGILGGLVGVGGGVIMIPMMTELLHFRQHEAHGTSIFAVVFTAVAGAFIYYLHGSADVPASALLAAMALCTVRIGAKYCCFLPEWKLKRYFGVFLLLMAVLLLLKPLLPHAVEGVSPAWIRWSVLVVLGILTGFVSGMMGVGGGIFMVPMMVIFAGIAQHTAQGISLLAMIPASAVGAWTHWKAGNTNKKLLPGLIVGVLAGVYAGGSFAHLMPDNGLRLVFAALMFYTATRYLWAKPKPEEACAIKEGEA